MQFKSAEDASGALSPTNPLSAEQTDRLYNDPYYGLNNPDNYYHWTGFLVDTKPTEYYAWRWECKTYFGLSFDQLNEIETNFRTYYNDQLTITTDLLPSPDEYRNEQGIAYWQWADAVMTDLHNDPRVESVTKIVNTVTGYPEISFFISDLLLNSAIMTNQANIDAM